LIPSATANAAVGIDEFCGGEHPSQWLKLKCSRHSMPLDYLDINRQPAPMLPLERRTGVTEVEVDATHRPRWPKRSAASTAGSTPFFGVPEDGSMCILAAVA
jgi:hypothetical protein